MIWNKQRNRKIQQGLHLNDDVKDNHIGKTNIDYDYDEHNSYIKVKNN